MVAATHIHPCDMSFLATYLTVDYSIIINIQVTSTSMMNPIFRVEFMFFGAHWTRHYDLFHLDFAYQFT